MPARASVSSPWLQRAQGPGSPRPLSFLPVLLALPLCVRGLPLQPCRTSCYRSCVLPSAPVMAALCSPGGPCPRPLQPSPRHVLQMFLPSPPRTRGLQALHRAWPDAGLIFTHFCSLHPSSPGCRFLCSGTCSNFCSRRPLASVKLCSPHRLLP